MPCNFSKLCKALSFKICDTIFTSLLNLNYLSTILKIYYSLVSLLSYTFLTPYVIPRLINKTNPPSIGEPPTGISPLPGPPVPGSGGKSAKTLVKNGLANKAIKRRKVVIIIFIRIRFLLFLLKNNSPKSQ